MTDIIKERSQDWETERNTEPCFLMTHTHTCYVYVSTQPLILKTEAQTSQSFLFVCLYLYCFKTGTHTHTHWPQADECDSVEEQREWKHEDAAVLQH